MYVIKWTSAHLDREIQLGKPSADKNALEFWAKYWNSKYKYLNHWVEQQGSK